jgi:hypothetical protein
MSRDFPARGPEGGRGGRTEWASAGRDEVCGEGQSEQRPEIHSHAVLQLSYVPSGILDLRGCQRKRERLR